MSKHAMLSPSGAHKWLNCSGSIAMELPFGHTTSEAADEGTAAHFLAAECARDNKPAKDYIGMPVFLCKGKGEDDHEFESFGCTPGVDILNSFEIDDDMASFVQVYLDNVAEYAAHAQLVETEIAVPIGHITGEPGAEGTSDKIIIVDTELQIHDLKFGRGVQVSADDNEQMKIYALGALELYGLTYDLETVRVVIHQPRIKHAPSEWMCTIDELVAWGAEVAAPAAVAVYGAIADKNYRTERWQDRYLNPAPDTCQWCKAKATCPKLSKLVEQTASLDFEVPAAEQKPDFEKDLVDTEDGNLSSKMGLVDLIEKWCKAVRGEVERRLLQGVSVPGYKLVKGRKGNRAWSDKDEAEKVLKSMRLKQEQMYSFTLISPPVAEKLLKDSPKRWKRVEDLITQSEGGLSVQPESDAREAVVVGPAVDDFEVAEEPTGVDPAALLNGGDLI